jgi:hypothetical protein
MVRVYPFDFNPLTTLAGTEGVALSENVNAARLAPPGAAHIDLVSPDEVNRSRVCYQIRSSPNRWARILPIVQLPPRRQYYSQRNAPDRDTLRLDLDQLKELFRAAYRRFDEGGYFSKRSGTTASTSVKSQVWRANPQRSS